MLQGMANGIVYLLSRKHWLIYHGVQCRHREPVKTAVPHLPGIVTEPIVLYALGIVTRCGERLYLYVQPNSIIYCGILLRTLEHCRSFGTQNIPCITGNRPRLCAS